VIPVRAALPAALLLLAAPVARAGDPVPYSARTGEGLARAAAVAWADDARLVWIESDEAVGAGGDSARWGYLFHSVSRDEGRAYSVRDGKIRVAADLPFDFPAPPLDDAWIDSGRALAIAEEKEGRDFRAEHEGTVRSMLLVRGLLHPEKADATTWAVVYDSPHTSGLWIVIDATSGKVVKTWRG
jgi:hypothetical protein